jgi:hypothetical protein
MAALVADPTREETGMADDRDRDRSAEDDTGVGDLADEVAEPKTPGEEKEQDEGPKVSDDEGLP